MEVKNSRKGAVNLDFPYEMPRIGGTKRLRGYKCLRSPLET